MKRTKLNSLLAHNWGSWYKWCWGCPGDGV